MSVTETTSEGCLSRLTSAIGGVLVGILFFLGSFALIFWNEGRTVKRARALAEGKGLVVTVEADTVDPANEGALVHMTGEAQTKERLQDSTFGVDVAALRLERKVEMYQWKETKSTKTRKRAGGRKETTTTYSYSRTWSSSVISSSNFRESGHTNPGSMPYQTMSWQVSKATIGAFTLSSSLLGDIDAWETLPPSTAKAVPSGMSVDGEYLYRGTGSLGSPQVGDVRIAFRSVKPCTVSFYSKQVGKSFAPYKTSNGQTLQRLAVGSHTAEELFSAAEDENTLICWLVRIGGFVLMWVGLMLIVKPFQVMADVIPFIGDLVGAGLAIAAFAIAAPLTLMTIAVGWIAYRPLLGIGLIVVAVLIFGGIFSATRGRKKAAPEPAPEAAPSEG